MADIGIDKSDTLSHHGIKGMRWGVRRSKKQLGYKSSGKKSKKKGQADDDNKPEAPKKKSVSDMSDDELRKAIARHELEREYARITASPKQVSKGKAAATFVLNKMVIPAAEEVGKQAVKSVMVKGGNAVIKNTELKLYTNNKKKS